MRAKLLRQKYMQRDWKRIILTRNNKGIEFAICLNWVLDKVQVTKYRKYVAFCYTAHSTLENA